MTVTGNTVTNPYGGGVIVRNASGTLSQANVSTNTFQSTTDPATSKQDGVSLHIEGTPTTAAGLTAATVNNNSILNFPSGNGVELVGVQITSTTGPRATFGQPDTDEPGRRQRQRHPRHRGEQDGRVRRRGERDRQGRRQREDREQRDGRGPDAEHAR